MWNLSFVQIDDVSIKTRIDSRFPSYEPEFIDDFPIKSHHW